MLSTIINQFESYFKSEMANNSSKKMQNDFVVRQCSYVAKVVKTIIGTSMENLTYTCRVFTRL